MSVSKLPPNNLGSIPQVEIFVNRVKELDLLEEFLYYSKQANAFQVIGEAGIGKTSLVRKVAFEALRRGKFRGGVIWLDCASHSSLDKIFNEISLVLDQPYLIKNNKKDKRFEALNYFIEQPALIIFDSFESVIDDDEIITFINNLRRYSKETRAIVISRRLNRDIRSDNQLHLTNLSFSAWMSYFEMGLGKKLTKTDFNMLENLYDELHGSPLALSIIKDRIDQNLPLENASTLISSSFEPNLNKVLASYLQSSQGEIRPLLHALSIIETPTTSDVLAHLANIKSHSFVTSSLRNLISASLVTDVKGRYTISHLSIREIIRRDISESDMNELEHRFILVFLTDEINNNFLRYELPNIIKAVRLALEGNQAIVERYISIIGNYLLSTDQTFEAIDLINSILNTQIINQNQDLFVTLLNLRSVAYMRAGEFSRAIGSFQELLELESVRLNPRLRGVVLSNLGAAYIQTHQYDNAINALRQSAEHAQNIGDYKTAISVLVNAASLLETSDSAKALSMYEQIQDMALRVGDKSAQANILGRIASIYTNAGNYSQALSSYEAQLLNVRELGDQVSEFNTLVNLGELYSREDRKDLEELTYLSALGLGRGAETEKYRPGILIRLAEIRKNSGDLHSAMDLANESIELSDRLQNTADIARASIIFADCLKELQRYDEALVLYKKALNVYLKSNSTQSIAFVYLKLAEIHELLFQEQIGAEELRIAAEFYLKATSEAQKLNQKDISQTAQIQLGGLYIKAYRKSGERKYYEMAWKVLRHIDADAEKNEVSYALFQENIGRAYFAQYERTKEKSELINAQRYLQEAFDFAVLKKNLVRWLSVAPILAMVYFETKQKADWNKIWEFGLQTIQGISHRNDTHYAERIASVIAENTQIAFARGERDYALQQLLVVSSYFEKIEQKTPEAVNIALDYMRSELGEEKFTLMYADGKGKLTLGIASLLEEARTLMGNNQFETAAQKLGEALSLLIDDNKEEFKRQKATILFLRGLCYREQQLWEIALQDQEQAFNLYTVLKDIAGQAHALLEIGFLYEFMNSYEDARLHYIDAYRLYKKMEDKKGWANAAEHLGMLEFRGRMYPQAVDSLEEAQKLYVELGEHTKASSLSTDVTDAKAGLQQRNALEEKHD